MLINNEVILNNKGVLNSTPTKSKKHPLLYYLSAPSCIVVMFLIVYVLIRPHLRMPYHSALCMCYTSVGFGHALIALYPYLLHAQ